MPIVSVFFGIIIRIHFMDHNPPHFHAEYQGQEAYFDIRNGRLLAGSLPKSALYLIRSWHIQHKKELLKNWELAQQQKPLIRIPGADS